VLFRVFRGSNELSQTTCFLSWLLVCKAPKARRDVARHPLRAPARIPHQTGEFIIAAENAENTKENPRNAFTPPVFPVSAFLAANLQLLFSDLTTEGTEGEISLWALCPLWFPFPGRDERLNFQRSTFNAQGGVRGEAGEVEGYAP